MGLHGGYGNNFIGELGEVRKGKKIIKCESCGIGFFIGSKMARLHKIQDDGKVICKRDSLYPSICKINQCGGLILPSKIIENCFVCNRCNLTYTELNGVFVR